jgi:hypothetical protein
VAHSFVVNGSRANLVVGLGLVPGLAILVGVFALLDRGGLWVAGSLGLAVLGVTYAIGLGALARRLGVRVEIDEGGIRTTDRGVTREIPWARALTVVLETSALRRGASVVEVRVDDGEGAPVTLRIPAQWGRVLDPVAREALPIVEREARVPLAVREARRAQGRSTARAAPRDVVRGTYASFPRTAWVALAFGVLLPAPALKLLVVDHFTGALAPCLAGSAGFLLYVLFAWAWVGDLELDERELRGARRIGGRFLIPRHTIARVERIGSNENDSLGVALTLTDGTVHRLPRVAPHALRDRLLAIVR